MCFLIGKKDKYRDGEKTARKDIVVYKVLNPTVKKDVYVSPHRAMRYTLKPRKTFHAWEEHFGTRNKLPRLWPCNGQISHGLHSYRSINTAKKYANALFKFVIPAGTTYYENRTERVSLQLRYVTKIKLK